jgi:hypothetical protein
MSSEESESSTFLRDTSDRVSVEREESEESLSLTKGKVDLVFIAFTFTTKARDHKGHLETRLIRRDEG